MSDNVIKLKGEMPASGSEAVAKVVAWLREQADAIESGESRPAHKAVLMTFEDCGGEARTSAAYCNASVIERIGMAYMALNDMTNDTD